MTKGFCDFLLLLGGGGFCGKNAGCIAVGSSGFR